MPKACDSGLLGKLQGFHEGSISGLLSEDGTGRTLDPEPQNADFRWEGTVQG